MTAEKEILPSLTNQEKWKADYYININPNEQYH